MTEVLIIGLEGSPQVERFAEQVRAAGGNPFILPLPLRRFPPAKVSRPWRAVYLRGNAYHTPPAPPPLTYPAAFSKWRTKFLEEQHFQAALYSFLEALAVSGALVINPLTTYLQHHAKGQFYLRLAAAGFSVPKTLVTSSPEEADRFIRQVGRVVVKPALGIGSTRLVRDEDLGRIEEVATAPVLLQEYIEGPTFRVHVIGGQVVLALKILNAEGVVDSRTAPLGFTPVALPQQVERDLVAINRLLGLHFSAWDIIQDQAGRYYYLDCNPGPYLLWIGKEYADFVLANLARYLVTFAQGGSLEEAEGVLRQYGLSSETGHS